MTIALERPVSATHSARVPGSWLVAGVVTVGMLAGLLVLTADLGVTVGSLRRGVGGIEQLVGTNDTATRSAGAIAPTQAALDRSNTQMAGIVSSLGGAVGALDRMTTDLGSLSTSLRAADQPLTGALASVGQTGAATGGAQASLGRTAALVAEADQTARALGPLLDETNARAAAIERKLRVLRLIPG